MDEIVALFGRVTSIGEWGEGVKRGDEMSEVRKKGLVAPLSSHGREDRVGAAVGWLQVGGTEGLTALFIVLNAD